MSVTLYHGPAGAGKSDFLLTHLARHHLATPVLDSFYLIVPSYELLARHKNKLMAQNNLKGFFYADTLGTWDDFLLKLLKFNLPQVHKATLVLSKNIIRHLALTKNYGPLQKHLEHSSLIRACVETFINFKKNALTPEKGTAFFGQHTSTLLESLFDLFKDYQQILTSLHHFDAGDLVTHNLQLLNKNNLRWPSALKTLYIDRCFPLSLGQRELLYQLSQAQLDIHITYSFDYESRDDPYFYPTYSFLGEIAHHHQHFHLTKPQAACQGYVFSDPAKEAQWVVNKISRLIAYGVHPSDIDIVIPQDPFYSERLSQLLNREHIPCYPRRPTLCTKTKREPSKHLQPCLDLMKDSPHSFLYEELKALEEQILFEEQWHYDASLVFENLPQTLIPLWIDEDFHELSWGLPSEKNGVALLPLAQACTTEPKIRFVVGYSSHHFPATRRENPLVSTDLLLKPEMAEILESPRYTEGLERYRMHQALNRTTDQLIFTYAQMNWDGEEQVPSMLLETPPDFIPLPNKTQPVIKTGFDKSFELPQKKKSSYSLSQLQSYQDCPFIYYARHRLGLEELPIDEVDIPGDIRGRFLHRVLERLLKENLSLYHEACEYDLYLKRLTGLIPDYAHQEGTRYMGSQNKILKEDLTDRTIQVLTLWLADEVGLIRQGTKLTFPSFFEWTFGKGTTPPFIIQSLQREIALNGRIDRIDVDKNKSLFCVIDYKTGLIDSATDLKKGISFQLPVYMMAAEALLFPKGHPTGGLLISFKDLEKKSGLLIKGYGEEKILNRYYQITEDEWHELKNTVSNNLVSLVEKIENNQFSPQPSDPKNCQYCAYQIMCHYQPSCEEDT